MKTDNLSHHFKFSVCLKQLSDNYYKLGSCPKTDCWRTESAVRSYEFMWTCRHRCRADRAHAAVENDPAGKPGAVSIGVHALSMQKLDGLGLGEPYLGASIFEHIFLLCKTNTFSFFSLRIVQRPCVTIIFLLAKEGHCSFLQVVPGKEGKLSDEFLYIRGRTLHPRSSSSSRLVWKPRIPDLNPPAYWFQSTSFRVTALESLYIYGHAYWTGKFQL